MMLNSYCTLIFVSLIALTLTELAYLDFHDGMRNPHVDSKFQQAYEAHKDNLQFFKALYKRNIEKLKEEPLQEPIPEIIHFIWLGGPVPSIYQQFIETCRKLHPTYTIILWDDEKVKTLKLQNQDIFDNTSVIVEKSDILRPEILDQFGGTYLDTDVKTIKSFKKLHRHYGFYAGFGPITNHGGLFINNGVIGSRPKHPILKRYIQLIRECQHERHVVFRTGPAVLTRAVKEVVLANPVIQRDIIVFPACYFSPFGKRQLVPESQESLFIWPETMAIHYYHGTWTANPLIDITK